MGFEPPVGIRHLGIFPDPPSGRYSCRTSPFGTPCEHVLASYWDYRRGGLASPGTRTRSGKAALTAAN